MFGGQIEFLEVFIIEDNFSFVIYLYIVSVAIHVPVCKSYIGEVNLYVTLYIDHY